MHVVKVGEAIAIIEIEGTGDNSNGSAPSTIDKDEIQEEVEPSPAESVKEDIEVATSDDRISKTSSSGKFFSPLVRSIAEKEGISADELENIKGTGLNERVTKKDLITYIENRSDTKQTDSKAPPTTQTSTIQHTVKMDNGDEIIEMDRMRKMISEHMVHSKHTSAHVTSFVEADVTNMVVWRNKIKEQFLAQEGEKITFTPLIMEAVARAIREMPMINVSVDGDKIIKRKRINIGMATALPTGNLIVPVIKDADQKNLIGLTKTVNDLANRARINKLLPDEIQGGTFTVTNVGTFGNVMGTPIINQPQVAIMAAGAIRKKTCCY